jgi:hypothetical protein
MIMTDAREIRPVGWTGPTGVRVVSHLRVWSPLDNFNPARRETQLTLEAYEWPPSDDGYTGIEYGIPNGLDVFKHARNALWLLDDGASARMFYTVTYHPEQRNVGIKSFPCGLIGGFGPRFTYHLMATKG